MLRSMFTAISSLTLHQSYLDVISDNLANANTTAYKSNRVLFQDQFAQLMSPGSAPNAATGAGGTNPTQVGLGVQMGYITPVFTQGALQSTGRNLDVAIQGDGFLIYKGTTGNRYSREGSLQIDSTGYLVNGSTGMRVEGWSIPIGSSATVDPNQPTGDLQIPMDQTLARATSSAIFTGNLSSQTATPAGATPGGSYNTTIGVYDSLGNQQTLKLTFTRGAVDNTDPANPISSWTWTGYDSGGAAVGTGTINFDVNGQADQAASVFSGANGVTMGGSAGSAPINISLDLRQVTMLSSSNSIAPTSQDGLAAGSVSDVFIAPNTGEVYLLYSNGLKQLAGQLALAKFSNPSGLVREGHSLFQEGLNSGIAQVGAPNDGTRGTLTAGYLEASNVDMAQEFTNMILAERGFQASSRVITTSDEMLMELVNLKR
jgi:flagellar hook protein FlgE